MTDPCEAALHELYHFLDGELTDERRALISSHLDGCTTCLGAFDFESELRRVVAERCRETVPTHLRERIAMLIQHDRYAADESPRG